MVRLEAEVEELRVGRVVVVLLHLDARVGEILHLDLVAELLPRLAHELRKLGDRELLGELVEDAELTLRRRVRDGQLDALERVSDVEKAARLAALAVDRERVADHCLNAEAVERGAE